MVTVETPGKAFGLKGSSAGFITDFETLVRLYVGNLNDVQVQIILSTGVCLLTAACINRHDRPVSFFVFCFLFFGILSRFSVTHYLREQSLSWYVLVVAISPLKTKA